MKIFLLIGFTAFFHTILANEKSGILTLKLTYQISNEEPMEETVVFHIKNNNEDIFEETEWNGHRVLEIERGGEVRARLQIHLDSPQSKSRTISLQLQGRNNALIKDMKKYLADFTIKSEGPINMYNHKRTRSFSQESYSIQSTYKEVPSEVSEKKLIDNMIIIMTKQFDLAKEVITLQQRAEELLAVSEGVNRSLKNKMLKTRGQILMLISSATAFVGAGFLSQIGTLPLLHSVVLGGISGVMAVAMCKTSKLGTKWMQVIEEYKKQRALFIQWKAHSPLDISRETIKKVSNDWNERFANYPLKFEDAVSLNYDLTKVDDFNEDVQVFCQELGNTIPAGLYNTGDFNKQLTEVLSKLSRIQADITGFQGQIDKYSQESRISQDGIFSNLVEGCRKQLLEKTSPKIEQK